MRKKGLLLIILVILFLIPACHRADHGDDTVVTVLPNPTAGTPTETPILTEGPILTGTEPTSTEPIGTTVPTAPEVTDTPTPTAPAPTEMPEPTVTEYAVTPTPTQVPYEGYVIGKDVNNNDLKMTPQEADDFVMAGNILKLYDGSWFDIDDDGEPEYVSIQQYGHWEEKNGQHQYVVENDGTKEEIWMPDWWMGSYPHMSLTELSITGYDPLIMDRFFVNDYEFLSKGRACYWDECIYVVSLDKKTKQIIVRITEYTEENSYCIPCVMHIEDGKWIMCGWLGCEIDDFCLADDLTYDATLITEATLGFMRIKAKNYYDGKRIKSKVVGVDMEPYSEPLVLFIDEIELTTVDGTGYKSVYKGDEMELERVEILTPEILEKKANECELLSFDSYPYIAFRDPTWVREEPVYRLFVHLSSTSEEYYVDDIGGVFFSKDGRMFSSYLYFEGLFKSP